MNENASMDQAQLAKVNAEIAKLMAETAKINRESLFYPIIVTSTLTLAVVAVAKVFL